MFADVCIALVKQVVMLVGSALGTLYGGDFYNAKIEPLLSQVHAVAARLEAVKQRL